MNYVDFHKSCSGEPHSEDVADDFHPFTGQPDITERTANARAIKQLAQCLPKYNFNVVQSLPYARRPLVTIQDQTGEGGIVDCDVSINNTLPLGNTTLLRSYARLDARVRPLVLLVKKWSKVRLVCGASNGNLSSYAWTIMVIYFLQLVDVLPSLQELAAERSKTTDINYWGIKEIFDTSFLPADEYLASCANMAEKWSLAKLAFGFFKFYAEEYRWGDELVSIRQPDRRTVDTMFRFVRGKMHPEPGIHVEDPFEIRDLNIVLRRDRLAQLKAEINYACGLLGRGQNLNDLMAFFGPSATAVVIPSRMQQKLVRKNLLRAQRRRLR